ncbi:MAG: 4-hydroxythreonine-4-phosphate dehydrogenase PdxA [Candidatus Omnitrophica bacterium]|nr:4-hydroxythreonine-4-phosphate dehydrogenase PdxA [Candidatus Omnitrophota bacterium]
MKPVICITMGDPSGIGPEIIIKSLSAPAVREAASFIIVGDEFVFKQTTALTGAAFKYKTIKNIKQIDSNSSGVLLLDLKNINRKNYRYGCVCSEYGKAAIEYIKKAYLLIKSEKAHALVTAPINKYSAKKSGFKFKGHTEFLAHLCGAKNVAMMLTGGPFTIVLATTHIPMKTVAGSLKKDNLLKMIMLIDEWMRVYFEAQFCKIGVCALNPHAGEEGTIGVEEKQIIIPAVEQARKKGINICGPYPADSLFYQAYDGEYDVILCMYHDQGLIPLKMVARDESVNITLGLSFIRTSPAHGTAFDIAGKNKANSRSFSAAIRAAAQMASRKKASV